MSARRWILPLVAACVGCSAHAAPRQVEVEQATERRPIAISAPANDAELAWPEESHLRVRETLPSGERSVEALGFLVGGPRGEIVIDVPHRSSVPTRLVVQAGELHDELAREVRTVEPTATTAEVMREALTTHPMPGTRITSVVVFVRGPAKLVATAAEHRYEVAYGEALVLSQGRIAAAVALYSIAIHQASLEKTLPPIRAHLSRARQLLVDHFGDARELFESFRFVDGLVTDVRARDASKRHRPTRYEAELLAKLDALARGAKP